jgi:hypothetical protein
MMMFRYSIKPDVLRRQISRQLVRTPGWPLAYLLAVGLAAGIAAQEARAVAPPEPFKVAKIHFETNASACDMGIQIAFDTDGITDGSVKSPKGQMIYQFRSKGSMQKTGGQTEGLLEGIEPQITELLEALGCEPSDEEGETSLDELFNAFPAGDYTLEGKSQGARFEDQATLTHAIPAGPKITAPAPGTGSVNPNASLLIDWEPVAGPILPELGPVSIVGYHVVVVETGAEALPQLDVDVAADETDLTVPEQYIKPNKVYQFEVLATEGGGNQTISEGLFCTAPIATVNCVLP